jgi:hypothetical protein
MLLSAMLLLLVGAAVTARAYEAACMASSSEGCAVPGAYGKQGCLPAWDTCQPVSTCGKIKWAPDGDAGAPDSKAWCFDGCAQVCCATHYDV